MSDDSSERRRSVLLQTLMREGIRDPCVLDAIAAVPREEFIPEAMRHLAYDNHALAIGCGQTISQPYIVALMTEALVLTGSERVLEIGTGSGYQCAILAKLAQCVFTVERIAELSIAARHLLESLGFSNVRFRIGDGALGWPEEAPFDRVIVTAVAPQVPAPLVEQLVDGGILVMPVGNEESQSLYAFRRDGADLVPTYLCACRFVPLIVGGSRSLQLFDEPPA